MKSQIQLATHKIPRKDNKTYKYYYYYFLCIGKRMFELKDSHPYAPEKRLIEVSVGEIPLSELTYSDTWTHGGHLKIMYENPPALKIEDLFNYRLLDIPNEVTFYFGMPDESNYDPLSLKLTKNEISFRIHHNHEGWPHDWSIKALFSELKKICGSEEDPFFADYEEDLTNDYYSIYFSHKYNGKMTIREIYEKGKFNIKSLQENAIINLNNRFYNYPFQAKFKFPDHIKYDCEQYLLYFGQFLWDIGIESDTEIKRKGNEILFSATPKDKNEAIEKISTAFSLFISIPAIQGDNILVDSGSIENQVKFQRLESHVAHLKSQLKLSEAIILSQQDHISSLKKNSTDIFLKSLVQINEKGSETDGINFFDGIARIKKYEGKGFEIDIPKVMSKIGNLLKRQ